MENKLLVEIILLKEMLTLAGNFNLYTFLSTSTPTIYPKWWGPMAVIPVMDIRY